VAHLRVNGRFEPPHQYPDHQWTTTDGIVVTVTSGEIEAEWATAPDASQKSWRTLELSVEGPVLIENLQRVVPLRVVWSGHTEFAHGRGWTVFAPAVAVGWTSKRNPQPLDRNAVAAATLVNCPEIERALGQFRRAMEVWEGDATESLGRLFMAIEEILLARFGDTGRGQWGMLAKLVGQSPDVGTRLFDSLQSGRHIDVSRSLARLTQAGVAAYQPGECLNVVASLLGDYVSWAVANPC
jgi:hypothetical protein